MQVRREIPLPVRKVESPVAFQAELPVVFWVAFSDLYVRLCSMGIWSDPRLLG